MLLMLILAAPIAPAGGFFLPHQSARSTGLGDAGLVSRGEMSLLHRNPAALSFLEGTVLALGTTVVVPDTRFTSLAGTETKMQSMVSFPPNAALSHTFGRGFAIGISAAIPFAVRSEWPDRWALAADAVRTDLRVVYVSPGLAFRLGERASFGVALNLGFGRVQANHRIPSLIQGTPDPMQSVDATSRISYGVTAGLFLHPSDHLSLGVSYASRMRVDWEDARVTYSPPEDTLAGLYPEQVASFMIETPDILSGGLGLDLARWLRLEANASYLFWSHFRNNVASAAIGTALPSGLDAAAGSEGWTNSWSFYGGLELPFEEFAIRAGYLFEQTPVKGALLNPAIPDADRRGFSAGLGYHVSPGLRLDFAYQQLRFEDRSVPPLVSESGPGKPGGTYSSTWTVLGISISYFWK